MCGPSFALPFTVTAARRTKRDSAEVFGRNVVTTAIHRLVEQHAAARPGVPAVVDGPRMLTYRELNHRANGCARALLEQGFRRGAHAIVRMEPGSEMAVVLLAVLKAGGSYTWIDARACDGARALTFAPGGPTTALEHYLPIALASVLVDERKLSPNLPIIARGSDVACVLPGAGGVPEVLVPHATVVALQNKRASGEIGFCGDPGAFDLWRGLTAGGTVTTVVQEPVVAAA
jgi:non-ribosomal peptide synthetase component F